MGHSIKKWIPLWIKCPVAVFIQQIGQLPFRVILCNMFRSYTQNTHCPDSTNTKSLQLVHKTIYTYLAGRYSDCIELVLANYSCGSQKKDAPIWVFWWQGKKNTPYIINSCIDNIQKAAGHHPVYILDASNFQDYTSIPAHIMEKFHSGKLSITHLSDYVRVKLLSEHGGLWVDGSIFVQRQIPESVFSQPIWTIRNPGNDTTNISNWNWTIGVLGGWKGNTLFYSVAELLSCYWKDHDIPVDYFVMDYMMKLVYDTCDAVRNQINSIAPNNDQFYYLQDHANLPIDIASFRQTMNSKTWLFKISWKGDYKLCTPDGHDTFYAHWRREYGSSTKLGDHK